MRKKVRKKPDQEAEKEPVVVVVNKEKGSKEPENAEKMSPVEQERHGMRALEPGEVMNPIKS
ncbi:hypothetical protein [Algoriphagus boritolerans]|uniref:Uncharacterized protein n=1 Tax=Algoriphagus boritolerans DSM 17298 = JCM 18970 TaxID=1120964 RepID=A0A1H5YPP3_9BACT|nr:hypothetical protein [Algoriphagus boritolerans]SEG25535.1 hypothetical protein SAMN03080598_03105 [Algoriphagus boritolerans DSM 17298 = JCM 18970]